MLNERRSFWAIIIFLFLLPAACAPGAGNIQNSATTTAPAVSSTHPPLDPTYAAQIATRRSPNIPDLPFPDNPDPNQCGIPVRWGEDGRAWLSGLYEGELVQPIVLLYDSHLRFNVVARAPHGSEVQVILFQDNPVVDYYLVKVQGADQPNEGWVPAPFLSFDPVQSLETGS